jgi:hypothetical protein
MATADLQDRRREAIRSTLARHSEGSADSSAIAEATLRTWREVAAQLAPVIGPRGTDALFIRSLHLMCSRYPWLGGAQGGPEGGAPLVSLKAHLETREASVASEACQALLVTFTEQLASLIGESLTERLLGPVWIPSPRASAPKRKP